MNSAIKGIFNCSQLFKKSLEDISLFCWVTDIPVLDFWWIPSRAHFVTCVQRNSKIHLWCGTCLPIVIVTNLKSMGHCTTLLEHIFLIRTSCFDTGFASQMKFKTLSLLHCFDHSEICLDLFSRVHVPQSWPRRSPNINYRLHT